jgi:hypothetical protein
MSGVSAQNLVTRLLVMDKSGLTRRLFSVFESVRRGFAIAAHRKRPQHGQPALASTLETTLLAVVTTFPSATFSGAVLDLSLAFTGNPHQRHL